MLGHYVLTKQTICAIIAMKHHLLLYNDVSYLKIRFYYRKEVIRLELRGYEVGQKIGESSRCRLYLGGNATEQVIIKVAKTFEDGDILAEEANWFCVINTFIKQVAKMQSDLGKTDSHYDWLFAELVSSFLEPTQGDRLINIFRFVDIELSDLVPLPKLRQETKIDARTSVWILGRFLKIYGFYELLSNSEDNPIFRYANFSPGDFFIAPKTHRLIYYHHSGHITEVVAITHVKQIAQFILDWTEAKDDSSERAYVELLQDLATKGRVSFEETHAEFYKFVRELWGAQYYPFTYRKEFGVWEQIKEG